MRPPPQKGLGNHRAGAQPPHPSVPRTKEARPDGTREFGQVQNSLLPLYLKSPTSTRQKAGPQWATWDASGVTVAAEGRVGQAPHQPRALGVQPPV